MQVFVRELVRWCGNIVCPVPRPIRTTNAWLLSILPSLGIGNILNNFISILHTVSTRQAQEYNEIERKNINGVKTIPVRQE